MSLTTSSEIPNLANLSSRGLSFRTSRFRTYNRDAFQKAKHAFYDNGRHGTKPLPPLRPGDAVQAGPGEGLGDTCRCLQGEHHPKVLSRHHTSRCGAATESPPSPTQTISTADTKTPSTTHRGYGGAAIPVGFCPNTYTCPYRCTGSGTHQVQPGMQASHETGSVDTGVSTIWTGVMGGLEGLGCCQDVLLLFFHFMV